ncbi:MAG TPA: hypothetical protein VMM35_05990 [Longimicrobiales bacterium]|nr:hypothetical protein [Longimicrobiales bacterium]
MRPASSAPAVARTLRALGGEATRGDLIAVTALAGSEVERALEELLATGEAHVRVSASGEVVYHVGDRPVAGRYPAGPLRASFDRKTVQLIRAREGVLGIAELVEHTGLRVADAEREMARLAERFGGVPHVGLDGHVVHAFPELMASAHGRFPDREPRPAWVRAEAPVRACRWRSRILGFRSARTDKLRRHALGLVVQTALAGKGVVSLRRTIEYLEARVGRPVRARDAEAALRALAAEFDAPVTELDGDLFFGFRNVKRQFLASHLLRRRIRLARTASGDTIVDSSASAARAAERELEAFDRELGAPFQKNDDSNGVED